MRTARLVTALRHLEGERPVYVLVVGEEDGPAVKLLESARLGGWVDRTDVASPRAGALASFDPKERIEKGVEAVGGEDEGVCAIVLWDLDWLHRRQEYEASEVKLLKDLCGRAATGADKVLGIAVTSGERDLSFRDLVSLINLRVITMGDPAAGSSVLRWWCAPGPDDVVPARSLFAKDAGFWIRNLRHDYFGELCRREVMAEVRRQTDLYSKQREIDFWQDYVRNVLLSLAKNSNARAGIAWNVVGEEESLSLLAERPLELIAPAWTEGSTDESLPQSTRLYESEVEAADLCREWSSDHSTAILLWDGSADIEVLDDLVPRSHRPATVLVGREAPRTTWNGWVRLLSGNVLGGFGQDELLRSSGTDQALLAIKPSRWRAFSLRTLSDAFALIGDGMATTIRRIEDGISASSRTKLYATLAQFEAARELYLGGFDSHSTSGDAS